MSIYDSLGGADGIVELVEYRPEWPGAFAAEAARIVAACGDALASVEHIGSTSVPGLIAKPCLDIMPGLHRRADGEGIVRSMKGLGYVFLGEHGIAGRWYFVLSHADRVVVHAHGFVLGDANWRRHLGFRDYLRSHPDAAREYAAVKRELAERFRHDRSAYTTAKGEFIRRIEAKAARATA